MPFTRIALHEGKPAAYRHALTQGIQRALIDVFSVPHDDIFMVITEHAADNMVFDRSYLGIERSDDLVLIQIAVTNSRGPDLKKKLYARIAEELGREPGVRKEDVFVNLVEVAKENWSFGNGIAQYAT